MNEKIILTKTILFFVVITGILLYFLQPWQLYQDVPYYIHSDTAATNVFYKYDEPLKSNSIYFKTSDANINSVITVKLENNSDYINSTIEINQSYIKEIRYENNTMIINTGSK